MVCFQMKIFQFQHKLVRIKDAIQQPTHCHGVAVLTATRQCALHSSIVQVTLFYLEHWNTLQCSKSMHIHRQTHTHDGAHGHAHT